MDWTTVKKAIGTIAPMLAGTLGSPVAGVAVKSLCDVLGLDSNINQTPDSITAAIAGASPEQLLALKQAEVKHVEFMAQLGINSVRDLEKIAADDRASARDREVKTGDVWTPRALAVMVITGYAFVQWFVLNNIVPPDMREIVLRSMGTLDAALGLVLSYYFGSSAGRDNGTPDGGKP